MKELPKNRANFTQLTPLSFLYRTVEIFPKRLAWVYGKRKATYIDFYIRCKNLAASIKKLNIKKGDVASVMLPNVPEMLEAHFGIPMSGAILNSINTRLEKRNVEFILKHSKSKIFIFHEDYLNVIKTISKQKNIKFIIVKDVKTISSKGSITYENFLKKASHSDIEKLHNYWTEY